MPNLAAIFASNTDATIRLGVQEGYAVLRILIVEDDPELAATLQYLIEENAYYQVVGTAADADSAIAAAEVHDPDLVLLDLHLANGSTGFMVAVRLVDLGIPALFVSGKAPNFPMRDLALGCLAKPVTADDVHCSIAIVEDILRGRETMRTKLPPNLTLYGKGLDTPEEQSGFIPSHPSLKTRIEHWIAGYHAEMRKRA
ncbi:MAG: response regulator [Pirellulaceae bacterium]